MDSCGLGIRTTTPWLSKAKLYLEVKHSYPEHSWRTNTQQIEERSHSFSVSLNNQFELFCVKKKSESTNCRGTNQQQVAPQGQRNERIPLEGLISAMKLFCHQVTEHAAKNHSNFFHTRSNHPTWKKLHPVHLLFPKTQTFYTF